MDVFWSFFLLLLLICAAFYAVSNQNVSLSEKNLTFQKFQTTYLVVYLLAIGADWLQGPYVYALYQHYGLSSHQIDILFLVGFGSSMVFGTFIGSIADLYGRRLNCVLYGILYIASCATKHFNNFWILAFGRFFGGIATSILFSAFESWIVCEHHKRGFDGDLLGVLFSRAIFWNSIVSIAAGQVAQVSVDRFGYVAPFDIAIFVLIMMTICLYLMWSENFGDKDSKVLPSLNNAIKLIREDKIVLLLGLVQSLFEGAMYIFVLKWTPILTPKNEDLTDEHSATIPHGLIFSSFMVCVMIGSSLFKMLLKNFKVENSMRFVLLIAACSLLVPVVMAEEKTVILCAFFVFEVCVGIFWPSMSTMRGSYVPENVRSTIMNVFRVPLNLIVIVVLLQDFNNTVVFACCVIGLGLAALAQNVMYREVFKHQSSTLSKGIEKEPNIV